MIIGVWVDVLIIGTSDGSFLYDTKQMMKTKFNIRDLDRLSYFHCIDLKQENWAVLHFLNFYFVICVCRCSIAMSVPCSLVVTHLERAVILDILYVMFSCVFVTFTYDVLGQLGYLIVSILDLYIPLYFLELNQTGIYLISRLI